MSEYYDGTKILSMTDLNGNKPEIYMITSNRTGGKTTYFGRLCINRFKKYGEKFMLLYRYSYELDNVEDNFFKDIKELFFLSDEMTSKKRSKGVYVELFLNGVSCGYAVALNNADAIKKRSHLFSDTACMLFDEFQSETNNYCNDEVTKFISIHTSVARGQGKQVRRVPVYMLANPVTIINPYYVKLKISGRLRDDTKFLRGDGFILEQGYVDSASNAQKDSAFNRAFADDEYVTYASQAVYLNDNKSFVEKPQGQSRYLATLKYHNRYYAMREYAESGIIYCDDKPDLTYRYRITVTTDDHQINYVMLKRNDMFISQLRFYFERGCFRFKDLSCKEVILEMLSY